MQDRICQVDEPLATRGRTIHWVNSAVLAVRRSLPVYPNKQTNSEPAATSQKCQTRTSQRSFDHVVGPSKQCRRHHQVKHLAVMR
jgi:hypothetical protein